MERGELVDQGNGWSHMLGELRSDKCDFIAGNPQKKYTYCKSISKPLTVYFIYLFLLKGGFFPDHEVHADFGPVYPIFQDRYTW